MYIYRSEEYIERKFSPLSKAIERDLEYVATLIRNLLNRNVAPGAQVQNQEQNQSGMQVHPNSSFLTNEPFVDSLIMNPPGSAGIHQGQGSYLAAGQNGQDGVHMIQDNNNLVYVDDDLQLPLEHEMMHNPNMMHPQQLHQHGPIHNPYYPQQMGIPGAMMPYGNPMQMQMQYMPMGGQMPYPQTDSGHPVRGRKHRSGNKKHHSKSKRELSPLARYFPGVVPPPITRHKHKEEGEPHLVMKQSRMHDNEGIMSDNNMRGGGMTPPMMEMNHHLHPHEVLQQSMQQGYNQAQNPNYSQPGTNSQTGSRHSIHSTEEQQHQAQYNSNHPNSTHSDRSSVNRVKSAPAKDRKTVERLEAEEERDPEETGGSKKRENFRSKERVKPVSSPNIRGNQEYSQGMIGDDLAQGSVSGVHPTGMHEGMDIGVDEEPFVHQFNDNDVSGLSNFSPSVGDSDGLAKALRPKSSRGYKK